MGTHLLMLCGVMALWNTPMPAAAADIKVIANTSVSVSAISSKDLRSVFLETKTLLADGTHVVPVLLRSSAVHEKFVRQFIGKTDAGLEMYYRSLVFTGKGLIPKTLGSDAE